MLHPSPPPTPHPRTTTKYTDYILLLQEPHQDIEWWWRGILHKSINGLFCYDAQKSRRIPYKYSPTPPHASLQSNATVAFDAGAAPQFLQFSVRTCHGHGSFPVTLLQCMSNIVKPIKRFWTVAAATQGLAVCSSTRIVNHPERGCKGEPHNYNLD